jgi:hypothetical protein
LGQKLGFEAKCYYDATGAGQGTWVELTIVKDLSLNQEADEAEATIRGDDGEKSWLQGLKDRSIEIVCGYLTSDAGYQALRDAWNNNTPIGLAFMDGDIATIGSEGYQADFVVTGFNRSENLSEPMTATFTVKRTSSAFAHGWKVITV